MGITVGENIGATLVLCIAVSQPIYVTTTVPVSDHNINTAQAVTITENVTFAPDFIINVNDSVSITEDNPVSSDFNPNISDLLTITENIDTTLVDIVNVNESVTLTKLGRGILV
jgi:hypothetical protein